MTLFELTREKKKYSNLIKFEYDFPKINKCVWLIKIADKEVLKKLIKWLCFLPANFVLVTSEAFKKDSDNIVFVDYISDYEIWTDFVVCDDNQISLNNYFKKGITPIVYKLWHFSSILIEFNPMKNKGNSFLYDNFNAWSIFYTIVRYLENYRFPFDNKNLIKNVFES